MGERHLLWIVNIWRQTESVCLSFYDRKPSSQHTCWRLELPLAQHNLHISPPVDTWLHTCTLRISKSVTSLSSEPRTRNSSHEPVWNSAPCYTPCGPSNQHRLTDRTGMASGLVCKRCSTSYLFASGALPLYRSALFVAPPLFPSSFCLITYTRREDRVKMQTEHTCR